MIALGPVRLNLVSFALQQLITDSLRLHAIKFLPKASSDLPSPSRSFPPSPVLDNHDRNSFAPGERERMLDDKATLETAYNTLIEEHTSLRAQFVSHTSIVY